MKIAPRAAESFLGAPGAAHRAALLYGPDMGLTRERAMAVKSAVMKGNDDPFAHVEMEEAALLADPARLSDELSSIGLLGGQRFIHLRGAGDKSTRIIADAVPALHESVYLLVSAGELPSRSSLRALFEKEALLAALASYRDEPRDVQGVVRRHLDEAGVRLPPDAMAWLCGQLGNDRAVTRQELDKIVVFAGEGRTLTLEEVQELVDYNRETALDDIVNAAADRDLSALERMIAVHAREGAQPVMWLRALSRYFQRLYYIRGQMASGLSVESVISGLRPPVFFRQVPHLTRHAQRWDLPMISRALALLSEAELACKTTDLPPIPASTRKLFQLTQLR